jgi:hypothetical protein
MKWQEISTAPKDGTAILLYLSEQPNRYYTVSELCDNYAIGFWSHQTWKSIEVADCGSMGGEYTGWMPDYVCLDLKPTHWMHLPKEPK